MALSTSIKYTVFASGMKIVILIVTTTTYVKYFKLCLNLWKISCHICFICSILKETHWIVKIKMDFFMNVTCVVNGLNHFSCLAELKWEE